MKWIQAAHLLCRQPGFLWQSCERDDKVTNMLTNGSERLSVCSGADFENAEDDLEGLIRGSEC